MRWRTARSLATVLLLAAVPAARGDFVDRGGEGVLIGRQGLVCSYFAQPGPPDAAKAHGFLCALQNRGDGRPAAGSGLVVVLTRRGRIRCAASADVTVSGSYRWMTMRLGGKRCGVPTFEFRRNPGNGGRAGARAAIVPGATGTAAVATGETVGRRLRRGGLACVVLTADDFRRLDPTAPAQDAFFCARRTDLFQSVGAIFRNGIAYQQCDLELDAATGCGTARCGALPAVPVCL
jgi:hypothetical protein